MLKSSSNTQELRLPRPDHDGPTSPTHMDTLKSTFLPSMEAGGVMSPAHFCPVCGQQFERPQHAADHMQLCHGIVTSAVSSSGLLLGTPHQHTSSDTLKIDYPCLSCDDKFPSAQELDEHNRHHQAAAFLARCLACGIYGISSVTLHEGDEYKCMHCGSVCTAAALAAGQPTYLEQPEAPHTPEEMPSIPPEEMNTMTSEEHHTQRPAQNQHQQQHHVREDIQLKVPPLTVKLNKRGNGSGDAHPQVIIKQEPLSMGEGGGNGDITPTSVPVYTIQQATGATSVVVSTATAAAGMNNEGPTTTNATIVGNKMRHKCPDCPKTFKTPGTLAMHRKVHTGEADVTPKERPYTCSYCGKSFTQSNTLKQHTRIHTGEKPYHCIYCEKSFSVKDYLTKHIRTHTGEKPYSCGYCDKRFTQRSALTVHTTKLHPL